MQVMEKARQQHLKNAEKRRKAKIMKQLEDK